jgi:hypothetical protein
MSGPDPKSLGLRFSLRALLIATAFIAALIPLGGYALRNASGWPGNLSVLATALLYAGCACYALNRRAAWRAYWLGAAIFGLTYFIIAGDPWSQPYNYELFTTTLSTAAYVSLYPEGDTNIAAKAAPSERDFVMVAHMFWSLVFAFCGGWISLVMYWTGRRLQ